MIRRAIPPIIVRFVVVGVFNTLFGLAIYALFALTPMPTWLVLICSTAAGIAFNFATTGGIVFRDLGLARLPRFLLVYGVVYVAYLLLIKWLSPAAGGRIGAMALVIVPVSALNYVLQSRFVFVGGRQAAQVVSSKIETEQLRPIAVRPPTEQPFLFALRCVVDLQLKTIARPMRRALAQMPGGEVLDVGAGHAPWRGWMPERCRYVGVDIDAASHFGMGPRPANVRYYDGRNMPFADGQFTAAICIEVLEHAEDPEGLLNEIARVLKPGGVLLLTTPWSARRHHIPYDFHRFSRERLSRMLASHGFTHISVTERGDDVDAIANKLIILTLGSLQRTRLLNAILLLPLTAIFGLMASVMLAVAHLPRGWGLGSDADPLGYFCRATRAG
jgi:SAM-dependent methyltransferase/putative flippase GtrA